jgi:hypothetical protein
MIFRMFLGSLFPFDQLYNQHYASIYSNFLKYIFRVNAQLLVLVFSLKVISLLPAYSPSNEIKNYLNFSAKHQWLTSIC